MGARAPKGAHMVDAMKKVMSAVGGKREWRTHGMDKTQSSLQKRVPYLVKKNFLVFDKHPELNLKPNTGALVDECMPAFVQHRDCVQVERINPGHRIEHYSPFVDLGQMADCKSFDMSQRAKTYTIRTFLEPEMPHLGKSSDVERVLQMKMQGQISQYDTNKSQMSTANDYGVAKSSIAGDSPQNYVEVDYSKHYRGIRNGTSFGAQRKSKMLMHQNRMTKSSHGTRTPAAVGNLHVRTPYATQQGHMNVDSTSELLQKQQYPYMKEGRVPSQGNSPTGQRVNAVCNEIHNANQHAGSGEIQSSHVRTTSNADHHYYNTAQSMMGMSKTKFSRASLNEKVAKLEARQLQIAKKRLNTGPESHKRLATKLRNGMFVGARPQSQQSGFTKLMTVQSQQMRRKSTKASNFYNIDRDQAQVSVNPSLTNKNHMLKDLSKKVHRRKIQEIQDTSEPFIKEISEFATRQNNIVLNALSFINDVSDPAAGASGQMQVSSGVDFGYKCKLPKEQLQNPDVVNLLNTKIDGYMDMSIRNIIDKYEKDKMAKSRRFTQ